MGKFKQSLVCPVIFLTLLIFALVVMYSLYGSKFAKTIDGEPLNCYVCEARRNYPDFGSLNVTGGRASHPSSVINDDIDGCLNKPQYKKQCEQGQYCAVLHQKLNIVERVARSCSSGGKLGCNTDVVNGIKEKACFCNTDLCIQVPFFYEDYIS